VRAKEIFTVLVRYGFSNLLQRVNVPTGWIDRWVTKQKEPLTPWRRIRFAAEELGPTFVKIAQILSTRPDILPPPLLEELKELRDKVKPEPFEEIREVLEQEFGDRWEGLFTEVEETPLGSGSIAQVHRARLRENGQWVAVKVQRPGIKRALTSDLEILGWLARETHERLEEFKPYNLPEVVKALKTSLLTELNFLQEANNATLFNARNPYPEKIFAPKVYEDLSSEVILVTDFVKGVSPDRLHAGVEERRALATVGGESVFHQMITVGFFHADPHPGNLLITEDSRICLLDWGMAGQLTLRMRHHLADLLEAVMKRDVQKIARRASKMSDTGHFIKEQALEMEITQVLDKYGMELHLEDVGKVILDLLFVFGSNGVDVSRDYVLLAKAVVSLEKTGDSLDPDFSIFSTAEPFIRRLQRDRWEPRTLLRNMYWNMETTLGHINALPGNILRVVRRIENEDIGLNLHHRGLEDLNESINRSTNRLVLAVIIGALIMGSSMIITTGVKPLLFGFPAIGILGYLFSIFLGIWVIIEIFRSGGHK